MLLPWLQLQLTVLHTVYESNLLLQSSDNAFVSGAGGLKFKSRAGEIGHSVANRLPSLRHSFERS